MKSPYCFVVEPLGKRYNNVKSIGDKELIVNTDVSKHEFINRKATIVSCPAIGDYGLSPQDEVIIHHNVFRRWYDIQGKERNSKSYFKDNKYIITADQIFLYKYIAKMTRFKNYTWLAMPGYSFVQPLFKQDEYSNEKEDQSKGVIVYSDGTYEKGEVVGYTPFSKYEFVVDGKRLYRVLNKFITIKYGYKANEETYNPSWA